MHTTDMRSLTEAASSGYSNQRRTVSPAERNKRNNAQLAEVFRGTVLLRHPFLSSMSTPILSLLSISSIEVDIQSQL